VVASSVIEPVAGHPSPVGYFRAGHPAPNEDSVAAAGRALALAGAVGPAEDLLVLLSGGASAMLASPVEGVSLEDKVVTARRLMAAGAPIDELNCVRKHLSRVKGGRLAAAAAGRTITLALSDVHGPVADDPAVIGSGPTVADATTFQDALAIVRRRGVELPGAVREHLERGAAGLAAETVKPGDPRIARSRYMVIGNRATAAKGARRAAEARGYAVITIDDATSGEAIDAGWACGDRCACWDRAKPPSPCAVRDAEAATRNSRSPRPNGWLAGRTRLSPAPGPTASMDRPTPPARSRIRARSNAPHGWVSIPRARWPTTTPIHSSRRWETCCSGGRPARTSATCT
jgi:glycerate-2-kinase